MLIIVIISFFFCFILLHFFPFDQRTGTKCFCFFRASDRFRCARRTRRPSCSNQFFFFFGLKEKCRNERHFVCVKIEKFVISHGLEVRARVVKVTAAGNWRNHVTDWRERYVICGGRSDRFSFDVSVRSRMMDENE